MPAYPGPTGAKCEAFYMKNIFYILIQTKLNFPLTLVLKVRVSVTNTLGTRWRQLSEYAEQVLRISFLTETRQTVITRNR